VILTLSYQEAYTYSTHVEPVEPLLNALPNPSGLLLSLPLQHTLRNGGDGGVVSLFYVLEKPCKAVIVFVYFRGILCIERRWRKVSIISSLTVRLTFARSVSAIVFLLHNHCRSSRDCLVKY
jgi:hypothetical protein